jgi:hypothetical protein
MGFKPVQQKRYAYFAMLTSVMSTSFFYRFYHIKFFRKHFIHFLSWCQPHYDGSKPSPLDDEASALSYAAAAIQIYEKMMDGSTVARSLDFRTKGLEFKPVQQKRCAYFAMFMSVMS